MLSAGRVNFVYEEVDFGNEFKIDVPGQFICPIGVYEVMQVPLTGSDGHSYEAIKILQWMRSKIDRPFSPKNPSQVLKRSLTFNWNLYQLIREFFQDVYQKNKSLLEDGNHNEAKQKINLLCQPIYQNGPVITDLIKHAKGTLGEKKIEVFGFNNLPSLAEEQKENQEAAQALQQEINIDLDIAQNLPQEITAYDVWKQAVQYNVSSIPSSITQTAMLFHNKNESAVDLLVGGAFISMCCSITSSRTFPFGVGMAAALVNFILARCLTTLDEDNLNYVAATPFIAQATVSAIPTVAALTYITGRSCFRSINQFFRPSQPPVNELQQPLREDAPADRVLNRV